MERCLGKGRLGLAHLLSERVPREIVMVGR